jgi:rhodanese-related sulfurtransferase
MGQVPTRIESLPRNRPVVVYCHHGMRSAQVAAFLLSQGYGPVYNLTGGIDAWSTQIDPALPRY